jgi:hypothetical protein
MKVYYKNENGKYEIIFRKKPTLQNACILFDILADIVLDVIIKIDIVIVFLGLNQYSWNYIRPKKILVGKLKGSNEEEYWIDLNSYNKLGLIKHYIKKEGLIEKRMADQNIYWQHKNTDEDTQMPERKIIEFKKVNNIRPYENKGKAQANGEHTKVTSRTGEEGDQLQKRLSSTRQQSQDRSQVSDYLDIPVEKNK